MSNFFKKNRISESGYVHRFLMAVLVVQIILLLIIRFWPASTYTQEVYYADPPRDQVLIDEIQITQQRSSPPPPPRPQIPQPVPSDEIIEIELDIDLDLDIPEMPDLEPGTGTAFAGEESAIVSNPQIPPTVVRIVEASTPAGVPGELRGNVEMIVNFLVDENGTVEEASIVEIRKYSNGDDYEVVPFIEHGLMDAVLRAALQWRFRPARQDGENVRAYTRQRFNY
ncbi:hypothetical protein BH23BAC3_BH23BAC3_06260 [soil metagenome]